MRTNANTPREDLQAIREIMERSSKFLSLSGLSGIFAGLCALAGAAVAWYFILDIGQIPFTESILKNVNAATPNFRLQFALDAAGVLLLSFAGATYFSWRKARLSGQPFWTNPTRRLLIHLLIPMVSGAIFIMILLLHNQPEPIASAMLIFYGLSLVNAGKFTFSEIHYLGLSEIALGMVAGIFPEMGLLLWTIGFGFLHIIYGTVMYYRYETLMNKGSQKAS